VGSGRESGFELPAQGTVHPGITAFRNGWLGWHVLQLEDGETPEEHVARCDRAAASTDEALLATA